MQWQAFRLWYRRANAPLTCSRHSESKKKGAASTTTLTFTRAQTEHEGCRMIRGRRQELQEEFDRCADDAVEERRQIGLEVEERENSHALELIEEQRYTRMLFDILLDEHAYAVTLRCSYV